jgi:hypothetical protein
VRLPRFPVGPEDVVGAQLGRQGPAKFHGGGGLIPRSGGR